MRSWFSLIFGSLACGVLLLFLHTQGFLTPLETKVRELVFFPIEQGFAAVSSLRSFHSGVSVSSKDTEIKIRNLEQKIALCSMTYDENAALRKLLAFQKRTPLSLVTADIVSISSDRQGNILLINRGSQDGIRVDQAVIAQDGILVGKIVAVQTNSAHALLLNDNQSRIIASIAGKEKATGTVRGEFQLGLTMDLIPITESLQEGDRVITSGIEEHIPKGLFIGMLSEIKTKATDFFHTAIIEPALNYNDLRIVSILISP